MEKQMETQWKFTQKLRLNSAYIGIVTYIIAPGSLHRDGTRYLK